MGGCTSLNKCPWKWEAVSGDLGCLVLSVLSDEVWFRGSLGRAGSPWWLLSAPLAVGGIKYSPGI